jgi:hypothetical protein
MTVGELIELLESHPRDMTVMDDYYWEIRNLVEREIELNDEKKTVVVLC